MWSNITPPVLYGRQQTRRRAQPAWSDVGLTSGRAKASAALRVAFGLLWAFAAWWKWQPAFQHTFISQIAKAQAGQPQIIQIWLSWWIDLVSLNPLLFARVEALTETALALCLIAGLLSNLMYVIGILLSVVIWATAGGFGGPFQAGVTTDIGTSLAYALLFGTLFVLSAGQYYGIDQWLTPRLGPLGWLASGSLPRRSPESEFGI